MSNAMRNTVLAAALAVLAAVALVALAGPAQAAGKLEVKFVEPQQFRDAGRSAVEREHTLGLLAAHLGTLAQRLPEGQVLRVEVLDVDLAGELRPARGNELRVLRGGIDGPRLHLRWSLVEGGRTLRSGDERLADPGLVPGRAFGPAKEGELAYERQLLSGWFEEKVARAR